MRESGIIPEALSVDNDSKVGKVVYEGLMLITHQVHEVKSQGSRCNPHRATATPQSGGKPLAFFWLSSLILAHLILQWQRSALNVTHRENLFVLYTQRVSAAHQVP